MRKLLQDALLTYSVLISSKIVAGRLQERNRIDFENEKARR